MSYSVIINKMLLDRVNFVKELYDDFQRDHASCKLPKSHLFKSKNRVDE